MPALLAPMPKQRFFTNANLPASNYKLYTYAANTTNLLATYSNRAATTPNANPITLDANGECVMYLPPGQVYDFKLERPDGVQEWLREDIEADPLASDLAAAGSGKGAALVAFKSARANSRARDAQAKLDETYSVLDAGAMGNGVADDTAAFQRAANEGGRIYVPDGTYELDTVICSVPCHWIISDRATLRQRSAPTAPGSRQNLLRFVAGSDGSTVEGGIFDGRRSVHQSSYPNFGRTANYVTWEGIYINYANSVTVRGVRFRNFVTMALRHAGGDDFTFEQCEIENSGEGFLSSYAKRTRISGITVDGVANQGAPIFQHGIEVRFLENSTVEDVRVSNFGGDLSGLEPVPIALSFNSCKNTNVSDIAIDGYTGNAPHIGMIWNSMDNCNATGMTVRGFETACEMQSPSGGSFANFVFDGQFKKVSAGTRPGLWANIGGVFPTVASGLAGETTANLPTSNIVIGPGVVTRFDVGVDSNASGTTFSSVYAIGNKEDGWQIKDSTLTSNPFGGAIRRDTSNCALVECRGVANGGAGLVMLAGDRVRINGGQWNDNGQDSTKPFRGGIAVDAETGEVTDLAICGAAECLDTQAWSIAQGFSYRPGTSDANNRITVTLRAPNRVNVGQRIRLKNVLAGPADLVGWVFDRQQDDVTLQLSVPATLVANSNTIALGNGTTSGTILTIPAGSLRTALAYKTWIKHPTLNEYRQIVYVNSNTEAVLDSAFSSNVAVSSAIVGYQGTVEGIPSQQQGISIDADTVGPVYLAPDLTVRGNVVDYSVANAMTKMRAGSLVRLDVVVSLSTSSDQTALFSGIPATWAPDGMSFNVTQAWAGYNGTPGVFSYNDGVYLEDLLNPYTFGTTAGSTGSFGIRGRPFRATTGGLGQIRLVITGGADNIASAGAVAASVWLTKTV